MSASLLLSLLLHATGFLVLVPVLAGAHARRVAAQELASEAAMQSVLLAAPQPETITLGLDVGASEGLVWIGHPEFQEQLARASEIEQAAFESDPSGGAAGVDPSATETTTSAGAPAVQAIAAQQPSAPALTETATPPAATPPAATPPPESAASEAPSTPPPPAEVIPPPATPEPPPPPPATAPPATAPPAEAARSEPSPASADDPTQLAAAAQPETMAPEAPTPPAQPSEEALPAERPEAPPTDDTAAAPPLNLTIEALEFVESVLPIHQLLERRAPSVAAPPDEAPPAEPKEPQPVPAQADPADPSSPQANPPLAAQPATQPEAQPAAPPAPPAPPASARAPSTPSSPSSAPPGPPRDRPADGDPSDRESDATSLLDVPPDQWRRGKPLATRGLDIKTKRPIFPELTRLTARPGSPIVEIFFDRTGVPRRAAILRSSGDSRIDGPLVDSLYRWRASGAPLARLGEGETIRIEMRILLGDG